MGKDSLLLSLPIVATILVVGVYLFLCWFYGESVL